MSFRKRGFLFGRGGFARLARDLKAVGSGDMIKVALSGAHSTGKTTVLDQFIRAAPTRNVAAVRGLVRRLIGEGFLFGKGTQDASLIKYATEQLRAESELFNREGVEIGFSDRTIVDAIAYATVNSSYKGCSRVSGHVIDLLLEIWRLDKENYDLCVYFPIEFPMVQDPARDDDEDYRKEIDSAVENILKKNFGTVLKVTGSVEERVRQLTAKLGELRG